MSASRPDSAAILPRLLLWTTLYVLGVAYSNAFVLGPARVTLVWPASGVAFAVVVALGRRWALLVIPLAVVIAHATFAKVPLAFVPFSVASNLVGSLAAAAVIRSKTGAPLRAPVRFVAGALAMAGVAALIGTVGLLASGMLQPDGIVAASSRWALGDLLGIACIAPTCLLMLPAMGAPDPDRPRPADYAAAPERLAWCVVSAASYAFVYWVGLSGSAYGLGMVAIPLTLLLWSALRFPRSWTAVATMLAVFVVLSLFGLGLAAFQPPRTTLDVNLLLAFLNLFATLPLLLATSADAQRRAAHREVRLGAEMAERQQAELESLVVERTRQLDDANRQLEEASQTDALTGLRNRRYLTRQLPLDLASYRRETSEPHAAPEVVLFALVDIDHFKSINDRYGHKAGDDVLQQFAARLQALIRMGDYAVRWGGEEFLLVLRPTASEQVATLGQRLCSRIAEKPFLLADGTALPVTCSVGFAEHRLDDAHGALGWEALVEWADAALYWVKHHGRDGWALLQPAPGRDLATLATRARDGADALMNAGDATVLSG